MKLKLILPILFLFIVSACKKSDDPTPASVVGKWTVTTMRVKSTGTFSADLTFTATADSYIQFNSDGTGVSNITIQGQDSSKENFTYKLSGTKVTITNSSKEESVAELQNLSTSGFVMYSTEKSGNDAAEIWVTVKK